MPRGRSLISKSIRKAKSRRRYRRKPVLRNIVNVGIGFPKKYMCRLTYSHPLTVVADAALQNYPFCLNGMWDPYLSAGGTKPMYFNQLMAIYNHYTVVGCKMNVTVKPYSSNTVPIKFALYQNDDTTVSGGWIDRTEYSKSKHAMLNGNESAKTLTLNWSAKKTFGGSIMSNPELRGNIAANPFEQSVGSLYIGPVDEVSSVSYYVHVQMEYIAVFTELKDIGGS